MSLLSGRRYADYHGPISLRERAASFARRFSRPRTRRRHPRDVSNGPTLHRELWWWTVRPEMGKGSRRFVSKPMYATREIPGNDHDAATDWMIDRIAHLL